MKIIVVHDGSGRIKTVAKAHPDAVRGFGARPGPGEFAAEIELEPQLANLGLHELHGNYVVDASGKIKKLKPIRK